jgi:hypothetical protein
MSDFQALKKSRQSQLEKLSSEVTKLQSGTQQQGSSDDDRFWKPEVDKAGNGYAVVRFLPAPGGEDTPFIRIWDHGFQGPGGWYIEKSLTTLGEKDPVSEYNAQLWNSGIESNKEVVRKQKRRLSFISNIYVVKDSAHPENEGKVFLFKYGKKIFEKLNAAMNPEFEDEKPMNPFDLWSGADFKLKIRNYEGYRNYDKSEFDKSGPLFDDDEKLEKVWKSEHKLQAFLDPSNFKSFDELKSKLNKVLGLTGEAKPQTRAIDMDDAMDARPQRSKAASAAPETHEEDESMDFFKKLAEEEN